MSNKFSNRRAALQSPPVCISDKPSAFCVGTLLCDNFTDFLGIDLTLHPMNNGPGWEQLHDPMRIEDDTARGNGEWTSEPKFAHVSEAGQAEVEVQGWFFLTGSPPDGQHATAGLIINCVDVDNFYLCQFEWFNPSNIQLRWYRRQNGNFTAQSVVNNLPVNWDEWIFLRLIRNTPTQLLAKTINSTTLTLNAASPFNTATKHGIRSDNETHPIDNFRVFPLP